MSSSLTIDVTDVLVNLDRATQGAASSFYRETGEVLTAIKADAVTRWPVKTGDTKGGFNLAAGPVGAELHSSLGNSASSDWPAYKQTWSRYSQAYRDQMIEEAKTGPNSPFVASAVARGNDAASQAKIETYFRRKRLDGVKRSIANFGVVPPIGWEKKQPWHWLIRRPAQAATGRLVTTLEADLVRLAKGG